MDMHETTITIVMGVRVCGRCRLVFLAGASGDSSGAAFVQGIVT
jgi:hypothetical protein